MWSELRTSGGLGRIGFLLRCSVAIGLLSGLGATEAPAEEPAAPIVPIDEVHAGQKGYGLSVFVGSTPVRFDVEVLGVIRGLRPDGDAILARLSGQNLDATGVIAGMSGSPVYLDGRLAGAVAFSWPFAEAPIAGITPIEQMRGIAGRTEVPSRSARPLTSLDELVARRLPESRLEEALAALSEGDRPAGATGLLWGSSGLGAAARAALGRALPALAPLGEGRTAAPLPELGPGSAVAALLVDGDMRLAATGTVTERWGDRLLAFGHTLAGLGETEVPLAGAEIVTVLPSTFSSFKISNAGEVAGAFGRDHPFGALGELGAPPRTVPLAVHVLAPVRRDYSMRLANVPKLLPALAAVSSLNAWDVTFALGGVRGVDLALEIGLAGRPPLHLEQTFDGTGAGAQAITYLAALVGYLADNGMGTLQIETIDVSAALRSETRAASLQTVRPSVTVAAPGEEIALQIDLLGYDGVPLRWSESVRLPRELAEGRYTLLVGDGVSADGARFGLAPSPPVRLDQALAVLGSLHSAADLTVVGFVPSPGAARGGELLPRLPPSLRSIWGAAGTRVATPVKNAVLQVEARRKDRPISGLARVDLEIRRARTEER